MADPWLSEIRLFAFNFAPKGWAKCDGQELPIQQNQTLFSLLGTKYGGNGQTTFALPDLRGRACGHDGDFFALGQKTGVESVSLTTEQIPAHTHSLMAKNSADSPDPDNNLLGDRPRYYQDTTSQVVYLNSQSIGNTGKGQPHENRQPYLGVNFCIAITGAIPQR